MARDNTGSPGKAPSKCEKLMESDRAVWWDAASENPMEWSPVKKWVNILTVAVFSFLVPFASSMLAPAVPDAMRDLQTNSKTFATFVVSIFVLGFATGPLLLSPLSELYGRVPIYHVAHALFVAATLLCATAEKPSVLLAARFLSGFVGVATITIGSGTIADLMPREKRGLAVSIWAVGTIMGPIVGPIVGGIVADAAGWRWVFWGLAVTLAIHTLFSYAVLSETYARVLLERKAAQRRLQTGDPTWRSGLVDAPEKHAPQLSAAHAFGRAIIRPLRMLLLCPIVTVMCLYVAVLYGVLYLLFATYSFVFTSVYGFSVRDAGLVFLPGGIGTLAGLWYVGYLSDRNLLRQQAAGHDMRPEDRLPLLITAPAALAFPAGLFLYGWSIQYRVHCSVPLLGTAVTGFGSSVLFIGIQTYLIDAFDQFAASVIAANAVFRGTAGACIPLAGLTLYDALGQGWGNSLLGFVTLVIAPIPCVFGMYGARLRTKQRFQVKL